MTLTLTLAAGLLAAPGPKEGWAVEARGYTYDHESSALMKLLRSGWAVEVPGHTHHLKRPGRREEFVIEFRWPKAKLQPEPVEGLYQPVGIQYYDELSAFFKQWKVQVEWVEAIYVDDLPALYRQLKKR